MQKELSLIKKFVDSLEANMLSNNQQAVLLVGENDDVWGGIDSTCTNYGCTNKTPDCKISNNSACINLPNCKCEQVPNTANCACSDTACHSTNTNCPCPGEDTACQTNPNTQNCCGKGHAGYSMVGFPGFDML